MHYSTYLEVPSVDDDREKAVFAVCTLPYVLGKASLIPRVAAAIPRARPLVLCPNALRRMCTCIFPPAVQGRDFFPRGAPRVQGRGGKECDLCYSPPYSSRYVWSTSVFQKLLLTVPTLSLRQRSSTPFPHLIYFSFLVLHLFAPFSLR